MKIELKPKEEPISFDKLSPGDCFTTLPNSKEMWMKIFPAKNDWSVSINCINLFNGTHGTWSEGGSTYKRDIVACERS